MKKLRKKQRMNVNTIEYFTCSCTCPCICSCTCSCNCWYACGYNPEMVNIEIDEDHGDVYQGVTVSGDYTLDDAGVWAVGDISM